MLSPTEQDSFGLAKIKEEVTSSGSIQAAIARTVSRSLALYFSRPVRLFRPAKGDDQVNGWQTLRNLAKHHGEALNPQYFVSLIRLHGVGVIPKHFIPPMCVNAALGIVLWETYNEASNRIEPHFATHSLGNAAVSGAVAGACQAVVAAPAENVRLILEGGFGGHSWSSAWKEVFREKGTSSAKTKGMNEMREFRCWFQEVGQMAGRGWEGWGWGCAKDAVGFATFFFIFELSRRTGVRAKSLSRDWLSRVPYRAPELDRLKSQLPAVVNGLALVTGGVFAGLAYEFTCRPFDIARRVIYLDNLERRESSYRILQRRFVEDGVKFFFQTSILPHPHPVETPTRWIRLLRTIARVGPWGIGFLVWEAYGP